jgi:hypothetical protein
VSSSGAEGVASASLGLYLQGWDCFETVLPGSYAESADLIRVALNRFTGRRKSMSKEE